MLVAIAPQMYREAVVHTLKSRRPDVEVEACPPEDLGNRVEIMYSDSLDATIFREGQITRITDISLERLLTVLDLIAVFE